jgi:Xaa-Pro aminopeptidase
MAELTEMQRERLALVAEKHAQATGYLRETGIDCWLTFSREGSDLLLPFVMGGEYLVGTAALMLFADGSSAAVVADYDVSQVDSAFDAVHGYSLDWIEPFQTILQEKSPTRIGVNYSESDYGIDGLTHGMMLKLQAALRPIGFADRLVSAEPIAERVRGVKTSSEVEIIRRACAITQRIFDDVTSMLKPGLSETDIAEIVNERMTTYGVAPAWEAAFCPSVASSRSARGHTPPGGTVLQAGDGLAIDFGVKYEGYCSDMMRTWYFKKPGETQPPAEFQRAFDAVRDGVLLAAELIQPGKKGYEVDAPVRQLVADRGYAFTHALGHQCGRLAHDGGMVLGPDNARYRERSHGVLEAGMIFTLEPVVGPIGLEDEIVVTETGCEFLHPTQSAVYLI